MGRLRIKKKTCPLFSGRNESHVCAAGSPVSSKKKGHVFYLISNQPTILQDMLILDWTHGYARTPNSKKIENLCHKISQRKFHLNWPNYIKIYLTNSLSFNIKLNLDILTNRWYRHNEKYYKYKYLCIWNFSMKIPTKNINELFTAKVMIKLLYITRNRID